ncbi:hypothetical protein OV079_31595 [Nannocystis pusilla]|uniref:Uncharacterized protein n=1 Tax=Nannocystis pusilla TaxID=889268 RepID=A0A9X3EV74_9BACT|nr:hypothetical protein [Nannocystis pusilla]MCY1010029.1 hypothetical protein [Nannocystis pusilla]
MLTLLHPTCDAQPFTEPLLAVILPIVFTASEQCALLDEMRRIVLEKNPRALPLVELAASAPTVAVEKHPLGMLAVHFKLPTNSVRLHIGHRRPPLFGTN